MKIFSVSGNGFRAVVSAPDPDIACLMLASVPHFPHDYETLHGDSTTYTPIGIADPAITKVILIKESTA